MDAAIPSLIVAAEQGDGSAAKALFASLYSELHRLAKRELARGANYATISPTTLLHEAYIDIAGKDGHSFPDRARFMGYAARVMRGLIIDHARNRHALKRGGKRPQLSAILPTVKMVTPTMKPFSSYHI